jgi:hypothetical protein
MGLRTRAATDAIARFEYRDLGARLADAQRGAESRDTRSHHHYAPISHFAH